jgi:hypothetical protein
MQRGEGAFGDVLEQREMHQIDMEMQQVELVGAAAHVVQHRQVRGQIGFERMRVQPEGARTRRDQFGARAAVPAGEDRDLVSQIDQCIGQVSHDAFCASVEAGRDRFIQRCDMSDTHGADPSDSLGRRGERYGATEWESGSGRCRR